MARRKELTKAELLAEVAELRIRLDEAEGTLAAIRSGGVDALIVSGPQGDQIFALQGTEHIYRLLVESMHEGALTLTETGNIIYCNKAFSEMMHITFSDLVGRSFRDLIANKDKGRFDRMLSRSLQRSIASELELKNNGSRLPVYLSCSARILGEAVTVFAIVTDISERKKSEEQNLASLRTIHDLYENAPCGYHSLDSDCLIVRMNDSQLQWLGYKREEVVGKMKITEIMTPESCEEFGKRFISFKSGGEINDLVLEYFRKDGSVLPVLLNATAVRDADGKLVMAHATLFDITERRNAEKEALRSARLASIGELAAGVAHEINNPINTIINYAQILMNKGDKTRKEHGFAQLILREGDRIATIVGGLLSFSRQSKEIRIPARVKDILNDTLLLMDAQLKRNGIVVKILFPDSMPDIMVIPQQIQQVFLNLISNARYALNKKFPEHDANKILEIRSDSASLKGAPMVRLTFHDYGTGIPAAIMGKIMNPFFTTKSSHEGTGLGLSICNSIVFKHGGSIKISSVEGQYTTVSIMLPAVQTESGDVHGVA